MDSQDKDTVEEVKTEAEWEMMQRPQAVKLEWTSKYWTDTLIDLVWTSCVLIPVGIFLILVVCALFLIFLILWGTDPIGIYWL